MSKEPHLNRKSLRRPDTFVRKGREMLDAAVRERWFLVPAIAAIVVLGAAYYTYDWWIGRRLTRDWVAYYQADGTKGEDRVGKLKEVFEKGGRTRATYLAAVGLADYFAEVARGKARGKKDVESALTVEQATEQAVEWYGKALGFPLILASERDLLTLDLGHALEMQGKWEEALIKYKSVAETGGVAKPLAMLHQGRMLEMKKDMEGAKALYRGLDSDFANSEYARIAKNYLRRMDSELLGTLAGKP